MKILVTGSTGFVGAALCRALVERGHEVRAFHRPNSTLRLLADLPVEHAIGDLTQPDTLPPALEGIEVVFHAAALLGSSGRDQAGRMYAVTVEGTRSLLKAAAEAGVRRLVHTSSVAALGVPETPPLGAHPRPLRVKKSPARRDAPPGRLNPSERPATSEHPAPAEPLNPPELSNSADCNYLINERHTWNLPPERWPYGYAKYQAELEVQKAVAAGLDCVIVNPTVVYGAGDIYRRESSLVMHVARRKLPFLVEGGLNAVHIQDVVDGHLAALERGRRGERYILGGENLTIVELVRRIAGVVKAPLPGLVLPGGLLRPLAGPAGWLEPLLDLPVGASDLALAGYNFYFDTRKAQVELGLPPPRPLEEAFADAFEWFKK